jgi:tRNA(Ile)-lysidine synthase
VAGGRGGSGSHALRKPPAVARVLGKVTEAVRRHSMFEPGRPVVVAVSGGPDSLCLLHSLVRLERLLRVRTVCFHFDHGLRPGSGADAAYVRRQARALGVPFVLRRAASRPARGQSVEAWARTERYEAVTSVVEDLGAGAAAVGHTADDQAETVLLALVRGGGLEALAGMRPVSRPIVRPLLDVTQEETEAFCRALRLRPRRDPMNQDRALLRPAIRHDVLRALGRAVGRDVRPTIARTAALLAEDARLLTELGREAAREVRVEDGDAGVVLRADLLRALHPALAGRVVRDALYSLGVLPELAHVDAVLALASARRGSRANLPGALLAAREGEYVHLFASGRSLGPPDLPPLPRATRAAPRRHAVRGREGRASRDGHVARRPR